MRLFRSIIWIITVCFSLTIPFKAMASAGYTVGGLTIPNQKNIEVTAQELYLSKDLVKSTYVFKNTSKKDILTEVKFVLPVVMYFAGTDQTVPRNFHFYYFDKEIFPEKVSAIVNESPLDDVFDGSACIDERELCGQQTVYHWKMLFRASQEVKLRLEYSPAPLWDFAFDIDAEDELATYCIDDTYLSARKKRFEDPSAKQNQYLSYGPANSLGRVGDFRLVIDKSDTEALVSFCGENVKKISPTQFEMRKNNYMLPESFEVLFFGNVKADD